MAVPTRHESQELANAFGLDPIEVILIALNRYGLRASIDDDRVRFVLRLTNGEEFYFAVCVNTGETPFELHWSGKILFEGVSIGQIAHIEPDTCDSTYFRRGGTELTLNSNARSSCAGCRFCGTYSLDWRDEERLYTSSALRSYLLELKRSHQLSDFSHLVRVTVCTGCFQDETEVVDHLTMAHHVFADMGFRGRMRYIGAQLGVDGLRALAQELDTFSLSYTLECFSSRNRLLHPQKAEKPLDEVARILAEAQDLGYAANFLYIMGLDELDVAENGFRRFIKHVSRFPVVQILQRYTRNRSDCSTESAKSIEYFLSARRMLEAIFAECPAQPRVWENYRGLWYRSYRDEPLTCMRM